MSAAVHFSGPARYQLRSAAALCRSVVESSAARIFAGPRPHANWFFDFGTRFLKNQLTIAFRMRDVQQARRYLDSFFVSSRAPKLTVTPVAQPQFRGAWFVPEDADSSITTLYFHGGGYSFYPRSYAHLISSVAQAAKSRTFALDYRLSPEFRFPAQLEDALHAYRWLLATGTKPSNLVVTGDSAGANLALALLQSLRDANLPQPALAIALSPPTDFEIARTTTPAEESADWITWPMVSQWADWFCDSSQRRNPLISPALADLRGLARTHLKTFYLRLGSLSRKSRPAFLPVCLCEPYLRQMEKPGFDPFKTVLELPQWRRQWILWRTAQRWQ